MRISKRAGAAMVGLLALAGVVDLQAPREASEMTEYYFYCGSSDDQTRRACDAVATALESHYLPAGETLTRRETRAFGAEEGLHIRLMFAIKSRYAIAGNLIWQVVGTAGRWGLQLARNCERKPWTV